jgi:hypothetical protein
VTAPTAVGSETEEVLQVVNTYTGPGLASLSCTDFGNGDVASDVKITAIQAASVTSTGF